MAKSTPRTSNASTNNAVNQRVSRYSQGGLTDKYVNRLGWWEQKQFPKSDNDLIVYVQSQEVHRPDLIAARVYGNAKLMWIVLQYNSIVDITTEITYGAELRLPNPRRVTLDILSNPTGGNVIK